MEAEPSERPSHAEIEIEALPTGDVTRKPKFLMVLCQLKYTEQTNDTLIRKHNALQKLSGRSKQHNW